MLSLFKYEYAILVITPQYSGWRHPNEAFSCHLAIIVLHSDDRSPQPLTPQLLGVNSLPSLTLQQRAEERFPVYPQPQNRNPEALWVVGSGVLFRWLPRFIYWKQTFYPPLRQGGAP